MDRRQFLVVGSTAAVMGVGGCLDNSGVNGLGNTGGNGNVTVDADDSGGYGPEPETEPEERSIDTGAYQTQTFDGVEVPLASIDDVFYWYQRQEARIADARGSDQYQSERVAGAVLSSAPPYTPDNDPIADWSESDRIVTYCGCPHHLSGLRAAALIDDGYEEVYALDEGFSEWTDRGYPLAGSDVDDEQTTYHIEGQSTADAGEMVMLEQVNADRLEAAPIGDDGSYSLQLHYSGALDTQFSVKAPDYTVEGTLEELTNNVVSADFEA
ncbi:rhodanese-like domain-containing protein [Natrialba taiwanensis]|uniref:Rhodanese domain-containing protein n=1 Tax=Natrialba taiwanensis DSM 12281 TaxID=1230458 RepID=L9ZSA8_9EURY|nr:rhodanese-like domain-containing protein [Natrialba taiwanensis]ELY88018.1 hypothetical protein C484_16444 [Natrialba taiwanensis DSM 12281]